MARLGILNKGEVGQVVKGKILAYAPDVDAVLLKNGIKRILYIVILSDSVAFFCGIAIL